MTRTIRPTIEVCDLAYVYPGRASALDGVSFSCARGTITGIVGPNGSGKTTLIKNLAGMFKPARGCAAVEGRRVDTIPPRERACTIAYVPQETHIPFPFTAFEVVLMGRAPHLKALSFETAADVAEARAAMEATDTERFASRCIQELSGGERQRVVLARALAQRPRAMLLDEPTSSLDIAHQVSFYSLLAERCAREGLTVVTTMHDLNIAARYCHRIVLLDDGSVASIGAPAEVFTEDNLQRVFGVALSVGACGSTGIPLIVLPGLT